MQQKNKKNLRARTARSAALLTKPKSLGEVDDAEVVVLSTVGFFELRSDARKRCDSNDGPHAVLEKPTAFMERARAVLIRSANPVPCKRGQSKHGTTVMCVMTPE